MAILNTLAALFLVLNVHADKESEKSRVDDCFFDLNGMVDETNRANWSHDSGMNAGEANRRFMNKKERCWSLRKDYEKKYGKYEPVKPKPQPKFSQSSQDRKNIDLLTSELCVTRYRSFEAKLPEDPNMGRSHLEDGAKIAKELKELQVRYKAVKRKAFDLEKECSPVPEDENEWAALQDFHQQGRPFNKPATVAEIVKSACGYSPRDDSFFKPRIDGFASIYKKMAKKEFDEALCSEDKSSKPDSDAP